MRLVILGAGLSGLSLALFLQDNPVIHKIIVLEKEREIGGLCRSFDFDGRKADIGPHIIFSRDKEVLVFMLSLLGSNKEKHRRNNSIPHRGSWIHYPFENNLSALPEEDCSRCLHTFLNNPYRQYSANNMLQFFLKTFGEGITDLYLRPYNEKIWKFNPVFMNTQMVDRIPRPPDEDIIASAKGEIREGHLHQLYFTYPKSGGIAALIQGIKDRFNNKTEIYTDCEVQSVGRQGKDWLIAAGGQEYFGDLLVSCMPVNKLVNCYQGIDATVVNAAKNLLYNNIVIAIAKISIDRLPKVHTLTIADKEIIFHRLSKIDFLGGEYTNSNSASYMMEYTYPPIDKTGDLPKKVLQEKFVTGLKQLGLVKDDTEVLSFEVRRFPYAYVVYDLQHSSNMKIIRDYFNRQGVLLNGRSGNFEYWNMDRVIKESRDLAIKITDFSGDEQIYDA